MDYELLKVVEAIKQKISNKYLFSSFEVNLRDDNDSIGFYFQHKDVKDDSNLVKNILKDFIALLKENGYKFKHSNLFPNPIQTTEITYDTRRPNDTTEDLYALVRIK